MQCLSFGGGIVSRLSLILGLLVIVLLTNHTLFDKVKFVLGFQFISWHAWFLFGWSPIFGAHGFHINKIVVSLNAEIRVIG